MRRECYLAGVSELFSVFRNALIGKSSRRESVDDEAVHWRIQSFLMGYNQQAQRYLPNYGTALHVSRVSDSRIDELRVAGVAQSSRTVRRDAKQRASVLDDSVTSFLGDLMSNPAAIMDDFCQVATHTLPRDGSSSSAAHASTLMVNGGSRALAPLQVTLPVSMTSVRPREVISTMAIESALLRTLGKSLSTVRTPNRFYIHLAEGLRLRNAVLVDCLPQPLKSIDDMRIALRRVLEVLEPHVSARRRTNAHDVSRCCAKRLLT